MHELLCTLLNDCCFRSGYWRYLHNTPDGTPVVYCSVGLWNPHEYAQEDYIQFAALQAVRTERCYTTPLLSHCGLCASVSSSVLAPPHSNTALFMCKCAHWLFCCCSQCTVFHATFLHMLLSHAALAMAAYLLTQDNDFDGFNAAHCDCRSHGLGDVARVVHWVPEANG